MYGVILPSELALFRVHTTVEQYTTPFHERIPRGGARLFLRACGNVECNAKIRAHTLAGPKHAIEKKTCSSCHHPMQAVVHTHDMTAAINCQNVYALIYVTANWKSAFEA